jgi:serine/threonine protein phosphatase PrpC
MFTVETHAASHVGRVRKGNEDNYLLLNVSGAKAWTSSQDDGDTLVVESQVFSIDGNGVVLAVSDGMGGALAGEVASEMAVETVSEKMLEDDSDETLAPEEHAHYLINRLYNATIFANQRIHERGRSDPQYQGMGATFTGIGVTPNSADIIQVGDSRAYLVRGGKIYQVTKDQSLVQQLIDAQQISAEEAETHTLKNVILQALGAQNEIYPVSARVRPCRGDVFLLCSDGLSNKVGATEMQHIVEKNADSLQHACVDLINLANQNGGEDNITVVLAKFTGDDLTEPSDEGVKLELIDLGGIHDTADQEEGNEDTTEILER